MDVVSLPGRAFILGDRKRIGVHNVRSRTGVSLTGTTGLLSIYDSTGAVVVSGLSLTVALDDTTTLARATYSLTTGPAGTLTSAGTYRAVYKLTFPENSVYQWEQELIVKALPF